jgi:MinD-like ATPase involved in chromosome partitioning or flagellar assembly
MNGKIHTFYSYKGGVGRTLCLANVATLLARWGWKVLCVDMDLEAPGLAKYLAPLLGRRDVGGGVVDWLADIREGRNTSSWKDWVIPAEDSSLIGRLALLPAGNSADHSYLSKVQALDWTSLYKERNMGQLLEDFKSGIRNEYDLILIDSRTGVSDSGGICTIQLPDAITFFFTPNEQSLYGAANTMRHVQTARLKSVTEPGPALMLPVLTRFEQEKEYQKANQWRTRILDEIGDFYLSWMPRQRHLESSPGDSQETGISPAIRDTISSYLDQATVPQVAFWSFGEPLPVLEETNPRKDMISFTYENIAALIANGFSGADELLRERRSYLAKARKRERSEGPTIFLSYSRREHGEIAEKLASALKQSGFRTWIDSANIPTGANFTDALEAGIRESDAMVVFESESGNSFIDREIASFIRTREGEDNRLNIIPIRLESKSSNPLLQGFQSIDGREALSDKGGIEKLVHKISEAIQETSQPQVSLRTDKPKPPQQPQS